MNKLVKLLVVYSLTAWLVKGQDRTCVHVEDCKAYFSQIWAKFALVECNKDEVEDKKYCFGQLQKTETRLTYKQCESDCKDTDASLTATWDEVKGVCDCQT